MEQLIDQTHLMGISLTVPRCPRCGYDVSGVAAAWKESCELRGVCSECGFEYAWADVFSPERQLPKWLVEYAEGGWRWWVSAWQTLGMATIPSQFFARVKLWHAPIPKRIAWWMVLLLLMAYLATTVLRVSFVGLLLVFPSPNGVVRGGYGTPYLYKGASQSIQYLNEIVSPVGRFEPDIPRSAYKRNGRLVANWPSLIQWKFAFAKIDSGESLLVAASLAWPTAFFMLHPTRRLAKIRNSHVFRASVYSLWWIVMWAWIWALWWIVWSIDGILAMYGTGSGIRPLRAVVDSRFWQTLWEPIPIIADVGLVWSFGAIGIGVLIVFSQAWWWHTVDAPLALNCAANPNLRLGRPNT